MAVKEPSIFFENTLELLNFYDETGLTSAICSMAYEFSEKEILPLNAGLDEANSFPSELWAKMGQQGLLGVSAPAEYGGAGGTFLQQIATTYAISRHSGSIGLSQLAHVDLCMGRIIKHGTEEQKAKYLPGLIDGTLVGSLAMSEPDAGSDVMSMRTRAVAAVGGYNIVHGEKTWITNGGKADVNVLYAKTNDKKLTTFLVEKGMQGYEPGNKINKGGMRGSETYQLHFDNCFVPEQNILGKPDDGAHVLMNGLNTERVTLAAAAVGLAEYSLHVAMKYTGERLQFGKELNKQQSVAFDLADMYSKLEAVKNYAFAAAAMYDRDPKSLTNERGASVFLEAGRMGEQVTSTCVKLCGGMGYTKDMPLMQNMNDMMLYQIGGGTEKIRQLVVARESLARFEKLKNN